MTQFETISKHCKYTINKEGGTQRSVPPSFAFYL